MVKRIGFILGSLRQESNSQKVAAAVKALFPEEVVITEIPIGDLPLYNPDLDEGNVPESYTRFRQAVKEQDGIVFITPEYNRGLPAVLKMLLTLVLVQSVKGYLMASQVLSFRTLLGMFLALVPITNCVKV